MSDSPILSPNETRARMAAIIQNEVRASDIREGRPDPLPPAGGVVAPAPVAAATPAFVAAPASPVAPASPPVAPGPGPTPAAPTAPSAIPAELADLIGPNGKYRTVEDFKKGYWHLNNTLSSATDQLSVLRNLVGDGSDGSTPRADAQPATIPGSTPGARPRVNPLAAQPIVDWTKNSAVQKVSEESGVPVEALGALASEIARQGAETFEARIAPMAAQSLVNDASVLMDQTYPNAKKHLQEVKNFITVNPNVGRTVADLLKAGNYFGAMEYGYTMYTVAAGIQTEDKLRADAAVAETARVDARANAGQPTSPNTGVHAAIPDPNAEPTAEERERAVEMRKFDGGVASRRLWLGRMLPPEMRTWERPQG